MANWEQRIDLDSNPAHAPRPRLTTALLESLTEHHLILVLAPPGYGKTALLAEVAQAADIPVCQLALDEDSIAIGDLDEALRYQLIKRFRRLRGSLDSGETAAPQDLAETIGRTLAEQVPEQHLLILDAVEALVGQEAANGYFNGLIDSLPPQTTLVLAGRSLPQINIATLLADNQVKHFGPVELALEFEEMVQVVRARADQPLTEQAAGELFEETEGWLTGVILSNVLQPAALIAGGHSLVDQYFLSNSFSELAPGLQQFLIESARLPLFNGELCDHALERQASQQDIDRLIKSGAFLFREGFYPEQFYRYHRQYQQFLLRQGELPRARQQEALQAAAGWYEKRELPEFAFEMYMDAGDFEVAAEISINWSSTKYIQGHRSVVKYWVSRLEHISMAPPEALRVLALCKAYGEGEGENARLLLEKAEKIAIEKGDKPTLFRILASKFEVDSTFKHHSDPKLLLEKMHDLIDQVSDEDKARYFELLIEYIGGFEKNLSLAIKQFENVEKYADSSRLVKGLMTKGMNYGLLGRLWDSYEAFDRAKEIASQNSHQHNKYIVLGNLATTAHYLGRYFEAYSLYWSSIDQAVKMLDNSNSIWGLVGLGELLTDLGFYYAAEVYLRDALRQLKDQPFSRDKSLVYAFLTRCLRKQGRLESARDTLAKVDFRKQEWRFEYLNLVEDALLSSRGDNQRAIQKLKTLDDSLEPNVLGVLSTKIEIIKLQLDCGNSELAVSQLNEVLSLIDKNDLYHFIVIEAHYHTKLREIIAAINSPSAQVALDRLKELERVKGRFEFLIPTHDVSRISFRAMGHSLVRPKHKPAINLRPVHSEVLFFLLEKEVIPKEGLMETIWPELPYDKQASNLHSAIYQIRKNIDPELILSAGGNYKVNEKFLEFYDAKAFATTANEAILTLKSSGTNVGIVEEALALYGGEFLPGFYRDWVLERRTQLRSVYDELLVIYSYMAIRQNSAELAKWRLRNAVKDGLPNEDLAEAYLRILFEVGDFQELISYYKRYEGLLAEELQLTPSENIKELVKRTRSKQGLRAWQRRRSYVI